MTWQLQEAKNRLSEVVREAQTSGPQLITVRGKEAVVVLSADDFRQMTHREGSLVDFLLDSPWSEVDLDVERSRDTSRDITL